MNLVLTAVGPLGAGRTAINLCCSSLIGVWCCATAAVDPREDTPSRPRLGPATAAAVLSGCAQCLSLARRRPLGRARTVRSGLTARSAPALNLSRFRFLGTRTEGSFRGWLWAMGPAGCGSRSPGHAGFGGGIVRYRPSRPGCPDLCHLQRHHHQYITDGQHEHVRVPITFGTGRFEDASGTSRSTPSARWCGPSAALRLLATAPRPCDGTIAY